MAKIISKYCKAPLKVIYTSEGTVEHTCSKCGQPTDACIEPETIKDQWGNYIKAPLPPKKEAKKKVNLVDIGIKDGCGHPMLMEEITTRTEDWKEEFDEEFNYMWVEPSADNPQNTEHYFKIYNTEIKDFISAQIQEAEKRGAKKERERWLRMLREEK